MPSSAPPWASLPRELAVGLRPHLAEVSSAVIAALPREVPSYARPLEGAFAVGVRRGVEVALGRFLDLPGTSEPALRGEDRTVYVALGRGELRQGRELEALLAAYRVGARVAFRRFATLARAQGMDADAVVPLAESVFAYIDELSSASVEGYAHEQSVRAGEADRRRSQLLELLLSGTPDAPAASEAARLAGWALPDAVVAVVVEHDRAEGLSMRLGSEALVATRAESVVALVPAPGRAADREQLRRRLAGRSAAVGPARPWQAVRSSLRLATLGAALVDTGVLVGDPAFVDEHLATLVVHRDPDLVSALAAVRLAPLDDAKDGARDRLAETLLSWLRHRGERQRVAADLHIHAQTVGYRLGQLRNLFGDALDDPEARFEIELALRARLG